MASSDGSLESLVPAAGGGGGAPSAGSLESIGGAPSGGAAPAPQQGGGGILGSIGRVLGHAAGDVGSDIVHLPSGLFQAAKDVPTALEHAGENVVNDVAGSHLGPSAYWRSGGVLPTAKQFADPAQTTATSRAVAGGYSQLGHELAHPSALASDLAQHPVNTIVNAAADIFPAARAAGIVGKTAEAGAAGAAEARAVAAGSEAAAPSRLASAGSRVASLSSGVENVANRVAAAPIAGPFQLPRLAGDMAYRRTMEAYAAGQQPGRLAQALSGLSSAHHALSSENLGASAQESAYRDAAAKLEVHLNKSMPDPGDRAVFHLYHQGEIPSLVAEKVGKTPQQYADFLDQRYGGQVTPEVAQKAIDLAAGRAPERQAKISEATQTLDRGVGTTGLASLQKNDERFLAQPGHEWQAGFGPDPIAMDKADAEASRGIPQALTDALRARQVAATADRRLSAARASVYSRAADRAQAAQDRFRALSGRQPTEQAPAAAVGELTSGMKALTTGAKPTAADDLAQMHAEQAQAADHIGQTSQPTAPSPPTKEEIAGVRQARTSIQAQAQQAAGQVMSEIRQRFGADRLAYKPVQRFAQKGVERMGGNSHIDPSGAEWDWFKGLPAEEQARLRAGWMAKPGEAGARPGEFNKAARSLGESGGVEPDVMHEHAAAHAEQGAEAATVEHTMGEFTDLTRLHDDLTAIAEGRAPKYGSDLSRVLGENAAHAEALFGRGGKIPTLAEAAHAVRGLGQRTADEESFRHAQDLRPRGEYGPAAHEMTTAQYTSEASRLSRLVEDAARDAETGRYPAVEDINGEHIYEFPPEVERAFARLDELLPPEDHPGASWGDLHAEMVDRARQAAALTGEKFTAPAKSATEALRAKGVAPSTPRAGNGKGMYEGRDRPIKVLSGGRETQTPGQIRKEAVLGERASVAEKGAKVAGERDTTARIGRLEERARVATTEAERKTAAAQAMQGRYREQMARTANDIRSAPSRLRPLLVANQSAVRHLTGVANDLLRQGLTEEAVAAQGMIDELPITLEQVQKAVEEGRIQDPRYLPHTQEARASRTGFGPKDRRAFARPVKVTSMFQRQGDAAYDRSFAGIIKGLEENMAREARVQGAQRILTSQWATSLNEGDLAGIGSKQEAEAVGYKAFVPGAMFDTAGQVRTLDDYEKALGVTSDVKFIPKPLFDSFRNYFERPRGEMLKAFTRAPNWAWVETRLAFTPSLFVGRLIGHTILALPTHSPIDTGRALMEAYSRYKESGPTKDLRAWDFVDARVSKGGATRAEVQRAEDERQREAGYQPGVLPRVRGAVRKVGQVVDKAGQPGLRWAHFWDDLNRSAYHLVELRKADATVETASDAQRAAATVATVRALGEFDRLTPFERDYVRQVIPFWSWHREITRIVAHLAEDHPAKVAWILRLSSTIGQDQSPLPSFLQGSIPFGHTLMQPGFLFPFQETGSAFGGGFLGAGKIMGAPGRLAVGNILQINPSTGKQWYMPPGTRQEFGRPMGPSIGRQLLAMLPQERLAGGLSGADSVDRYANGEPVLTKAGGYQLQPTGTTPLSALAGFGGVTLADRALAEKQAAGSAQSQGKTSTQNTAAQARYQARLRAALAAARAGR